MVGPLIVAHCPSDSVSQKTSRDSHYLRENMSKHIPVLMILMASRYNISSIVVSSCIKRQDQCNRKEVKSKRV